MSNLDTILEDSNKEYKFSSESYYDPSVDFSGVMPVGMYKAYATELIVKKNILKQIL